MVSEIRFSVEDADTGEHLGETRTLSEAIGRGRQLAGDWIIRDQEYGQWLAAEGSGAHIHNPGWCLLGHSEKAVDAHLRRSHGVSELFLADAGNPDLDGLRSWHYHLHAHADLMERVDATLVATKIIVSAEEAS